GPSGVAAGGRDAVKSELEASSGASASEARDVSGAGGGVSGSCPGRSGWASTAQLSPVETLTSPAGATTSRTPVTARRSGTDARAEPEPTAVRRRPLTSAADRTRSEVLVMALLRRGHAPGSPRGLTREGDSRRTAASCDPARDRKSVV